VVKEVRKGGILNRKLLQEFRDRFNFISKYLAQKKEMTYLQYSAG
jgi:hypothetical protein